MQLLARNRIEETLETSISWIDELMTKLSAAAHFAGRFHVLSRRGMRSEQSVRTAYEAADQAASRL